GLLYDMGYGCQLAVNPNSALPTPNLFDLPKVALFRQEGPFEDTNCTIRTKLLMAQRDGAIAAVVFGGPGQTAIESAAANPSDELIDIPGMFVSYDSGIMLSSFLQQQRNSNSTTNLSHYDRVRINIATDRRMPVIWELVLIVVIILLGLSFTISGYTH
ncbi:hypothetical protein BGZ65_002394, partial [Modicella reniformis]